MDYIRDDYLSGASEISRRCARHLGIVALRLAARSPWEYLHHRLVEVGKELIQAQPAMAPVFNAVNPILQEGAGGPGVGEGG